MRFASSAAFTAILTSVMAFAAEHTILTPAELSVGKHLQAFTNLRLSEQAPDAGLEITVTSDDPSKVLLSLAPDKPGVNSIVVKMRAHYLETPDFYVQSLADSGTATYTATAPDFGSMKGTVKLSPSAIMIIGPFKGAAIKTTPSMPAKVAFYSVLINAEGKLVAQQGVAGGKKITFETVSSDGKVGGVNGSFVLEGGESQVNAAFKPASAGNTVLSVKQPEGFTMPKQYATLAATVELPGIGMTGEINLGKNLQVPSHILLGEVAGPKGLDVTITSSDPKALLISDSSETLGKGSIVVHVPAGQSLVPYFVQGMGDTGTVTHSASAPGYRTRVAPITLAPSGIMVVYSSYGPPDEAEYLRAKQTRDPRAFTVMVGERTPTYLTLWPVYLDPKTKRGADITAQGLRPGIKVTAKLNNTNKAVGTVPETVTIDGPAGWKMIEFTPLTAGQTVISIETPEGFTTPSNAFEVAANVKAVVETAAAVK